MGTNSQRQKGRDGVLSLLNVAIEVTNLAKEVSSITPAKVVFGTVSVLLTMIRDTMANELDYVELGLSCAEICKALDRGMSGRRLDELSQPVCDAINRLTMTVAEIQKKAIKQSGRNAVSRLLHAKNDGGAIAAWKLDLNRILHVFNTELAMSTHTIVVDMHQNLLKTREDIDNRNRAVQKSILGESPPPPPRVFYGRDELIEKIVDLAEHLTPLALIGAGGIGKTSAALTVLHNDRIKQRFGDNRRFIRCDQFPASLTHFLHRLSTALGAGIQNPEDLTPLRPFLSSREFFVVLDNAESILDPRGMDAQEIYAAVEELSQFGNICLCVTSRISTIPPNCKLLDTPTLSMDAARRTFYCIYDNGERSGLVDNILRQLDFHPLSITLLATVAHHNKWGTNRLTVEWERRRTDVLSTQHNKSLAAAIELSLASPTFRELGPNARELLGVVAFFPQGIDENNLDWLFPTLSDRINVFDNFCILSLTHRSNGFITMLAPLRDHLCPKDPTSSQLFCTAKDLYFSRMSVEILPGEVGFEETRWIMSEDANVEHLLDIFTSIDNNSDDVWDACINFMGHLYWHKPRLVVLGPKIEALPDNHPFKLQCLSQLARLFELVGNHGETKRLLTHALGLWREEGDENQVAQTLASLTQANCALGLYKEGTQQVEEALEICERLGDTVGQSECLQNLARLLYEDDQLDAAEEATSRAIGLSLDETDQFQLCGCHRLLGDICRAKGETERAINHFEAALGIASSLNWDGEKFCNHYSLAMLFFDEGRFDDAHAHIERSKSYVVNEAYRLGCAVEMQAGFWYKQGRLEEAESEASRAVDIYEGVGAARDLESCRWLLQDIREEMSGLVATRGSDGNGQGPE